jgi:hypothetical protein
MGSIMRQVTPLVPDPRHIANITRVLYAAHPAEWLYGCRWYESESYQITTHATAHGLTGAQGIALFAVLSQQASIERNRAAYHGIAASHDVHHVDATFALRAMREKCRSILADTANPLQYARGLKVSSFARNLSGDLTCATIDRHAASVAGLAPISNFPEGMYARYAAAYIAVAEREHMPVAHVQAITWVTWRNLKADRHGAMERLVRPCATDLARTGVDHA